MEIIFKQRVSSGAFGTVWIAEDALLPRTYAVKFFDRTAPQLAELEAIAQASAMVRVDSPFLVKLHAVEQQRNPASGNLELALIMEYVHGSSLAHSTERFSLARAAKLVNDLIGGLSAIHSAGLVHRDLWDRNILITSDGARIIDIYDRGTGSKAFSPEAVRDDVRDLGNAIRQILERTDGVEVRALADSHFRSTTTCTSAEDLLQAYGPVIPALQTPMARTDKMPSSASSEIHAGTWRPRTVSFSPNGAEVALGATHGDGASDRLFLAGPDRNQLVATSVADDLGHAHKIDAISWAETSLLVGASAYDSYVVADVQRASVLLRDKAFVLYSQFELSPNGERVALATVFGQVVLRTPIGETIHRAQVHPGVASLGVRLFWSPAGDRIAILADEALAQLWDCDGNLLVNFGVDIAESTFRWWPDSVHYATLAKGNLIVYKGLFGFGQTPYDYSMHDRPLVQDVATSSGSFATNLGTTVDVWRLVGDDTPEFARIGTHESQEAVTGMLYDTSGSFLAVLSGRQIEILSVHTDRIEVIARAAYTGAAARILRWCNESVLVAVDARTLVWQGVDQQLSVDLGTAVELLDTTSHGEVAFAREGGVELWRPGDDRTRAISIEVDGTECRLLEDACALVR